MAKSTASPRLFHTSLKNAVNSNNKGAEENYVTIESLCRLALLKNIFSTETKFPHNHINDKD